MNIAIIGGTGRLGTGLALQLARTGHRIVIGSRDYLSDSLEARGHNAAERVRELVGPSARVEVAPYDGAVTMAQVIFVTVPYVAHLDVYREMIPTIGGGAIVVDASNPSITQVKKRPGLIQSEQSASAAEEASNFFVGHRRGDIQVVAGFQTISASRLADLTHPPEGDVLLCGDDEEAKVIVGSLVEDIPNLRWVDTGGLSMARAVERLTELLISVNKRYGISGATVHLHGHETFGRPPSRS